MRSLLVFAALFVSVVPALESADWIRVTSSHFELYTTFPEEQARSTLETFEQARDFFLSVKSLSVPPEMPVIVVAFSSPSEYKPYRPREFAPAYSTADEQRDYIVMSDLGALRKRAAIHEYVHVLVRHSGLSIPLWLNEGLAEVYSGMKVRDGKILLGAIAEDRIHSLGSSDLMRLSQLFNVRIDSPEYNEVNRASVFYAESCLLAHMLVLSDAYAPKFSAFLDSLTASNSAQTAFADVYGKSLAEVERDLVSYFHQTGGAAYTAPVQRTEEMRVRPATDLEIGLTLARITGLLGKLEEERKALDRLSAANKGNVEIEEAQTYLAWQRGDKEGALRSFGSLLDHGGANWKTYWDYARLLEVTKPDPAQEIDALQKVLELKPEFADARVMLGRELFITGRRAAALSELKQIKDPDSRYAGSMFLLMARVAADSANTDEARQYAQEARKHQLSLEEAKSLDALLKRLDGSVPADDEDAKRPTIRYGRPGKPKPGT